MKISKDLTGQRFGRLVVIGKAPPCIRKNGRKVIMWHCKCDCGIEKDIMGYSLMTGHTRSCGCLSYERIHNKRKNNIYDLSGKYGIGYTTKGEKFYFDLEDYEKLSKIYWYVSSQGYLIGQNLKTKKTVLMHRYIMNASNDMIIDHIGGSETIHDNRKSNLRIATRSENSRNHKLYGHNKSGVTGVYWDSQIQRWVAVVTSHGVQIRLGSYKNKEDAIEARRKGEELIYRQYSYEASQKIYKEKI